MPGDLYIGGGIYMPIGGAVDYWPVTGVIQPQHQWEFATTGNYTDVGSTGGLTLTARGTGNSFSSDGLVLDGNGWGDRAASDDFNNLGTTFSLLWETITTTYNGDVYIIYTGDGGPNSGYLADTRSTPSGKIAFYQNNTQAYQSTTIDLNTRYQVVLTFAGGNYQFYKDGAAVGTPISGSAPVVASTVLAVGKFLIGALQRVGILKGTAWSADDVAAIHTGLP